MYFCPKEIKLQGGIVSGKELERVGLHLLGTAEMDLSKIDGPEPAVVADFVFLHTVIAVRGKAVDKKPVAVQIVSGQKVFIHQLVQRTPYGRVQVFFSGLEMIHKYAEIRRLLCQQRAQIGKQRQKHVGPLNALDIAFEGGCVGNHVFDFLGSRHHKRRMAAFHRRLIHNSGAGNFFFLVLSFG